MFLAVTQKHESRSYSAWNFSLVQETRAYREKKKPLQGILLEHSLPAFVARCQPPKKLLKHETQSSDALYI